MAHLWQIQNSQWQPMPLEGSALALSTSGELRAASAQDDARIRLLASSGDWVLLATPDARVRINGDPLGLGCRLLRDRDEIVVGHARAYYSTERLVRIEPFPESAAAVFCARCRQQIQPGTLAVRCQCGTWCHETEDLRCWSYVETCPLCPQSTALDAGYRWEPGT